MEDISPKLLKLCQEEFAERVNASRQMSAIIKRIRDGTVSTADAYKYSAFIGRTLGETFAKVLNVDSLPDGKLYWNIAQSVLKPMLEDNRTLVLACAQEVQKVANKDLGTNIPIVTPKENKDRLKGLMDDVCSDGIDSEQLAYRLGADTENFTMSVFDDFIESNAGRLDSVGFKTSVIRTTGTGGCCPWCESLAGVYDYEEVKETGNDVWRRHANCTCQIDYKSERKSETVMNYRRTRATRRR